jgi:hypothetical protein
MSSSELSSEDGAPIYPNLSGKYCPQEDIDARVKWMAEDENFANIERAALDQSIIIFGLKRVGKLALRLAFNSNLNRPFLISLYKRSS